MQLQSAKSLNSFSSFVIFVNVFMQIFSSTFEVETRVASPSDIVGNFSDVLDLSAPLKSLANGSMSACDNC